MRHVTSLFLVGIGLILTLYVGAYLMLYTGIIDVIEALKQEPLNSSMLAWGIVKIVFCEVAGLIMFPFVLVAGAISGKE